VNPAIVISAQDNVATALEPLEAGQAIQAGGSVVAITEAIPRGHKVALRAIRAGEIVVKYGSAIGHASSDIAAGTHVHIHNVASDRGRGDLGSVAQDAARIAEPQDNGEPEAPEPRDAPGGGRLPVTR
jgi:altronate dehydratase